MLTYLAPQIGDYLVDSIIQELSYCCKEMIIYYGYKHLTRQLHNTLFFEKRKKKDKIKNDQEITFDSDIINMCPCIYYQYIMRRSICSQHLQQMYSLLLVHTKASSICSVN